MSVKVQYGVLILLIVVAIGIVLNLGTVQILETGNDGDSTQTESPSGLELIDGKLTNNRGCSDGQVQKWNETIDKWACANDSTGAGGGIATVKEADVAIGDPDIETLDFGAGLDCSETPDTEINCLIDPTEFGADWVDAITDIAAGVRSGADVTLVTGTAGVAGNCAEWDANGDAIDSGAACGGGSGDSLEVEDGDNAGTFTAVDTTANFDDSGDCNFAVADGGAGGPDVVTCTIRADSVALGNDTTGGYAASVSEAGPATTATALAANPADCIAGEFATTIAANGNLTCAEVAFSDLSGAAVDSQIPNDITIDLAAAATALAADPADCSANQFATTIAASGALTCAQPDHGNLAGLTDDDHDQYALLAGRSGGQTLIGGTGAGDDLTLETTSNVSKGSYILSELDCSANANGGALTASATGVVTCTDDDGGGGSGDAVTVNTVAVDTTADFTDGDIDWTLVDGGAGGPDGITATVACTDCVALATETTGNYVATIADSGSTTITVANSGTENAAVTLQVVDVACTDCLGVTEIADVYLLDDGDSGTGDYDFGAADSFAIPNGTAPAVNAAGEIAEDTTASQLVYGADANVLSPVLNTSITIESPADADNIILGKWAAFGITITDIFCIVDPADTGESVVIDIQERDATADNPTTVDATITCDNDGAEDDGTLTNGVIDLGDWWSIDVGAVVGTVGQLSLTVVYEIVRQ